MFLHIFLRGISSSWGNSKRFFWGIKMRSELYFSKNAKIFFSNSIATHTHRMTLKQLAIDSLHLFESMYSSWKQWKSVSVHFFEGNFIVMGKLKKLFLSTKMRSELHFSKKLKIFFFRLYSHPHVSYDSATTCNRFLWSFWSNVYLSKTMKKCFPTFF